MIDQFTSAEDDIALPNAPVDVSGRMRDIRARQGLKQSEVARRMGLDASIPSLWEQGKRPVPTNRIQSLAEALGVSLAELLGDGSDLPAEPEPARGAVVDLVRRDRAPEPRRLPLERETTGLSLLKGGGLTVEEEPVVEQEPAPPPPWVVAERPPLVGWIPEGWEPGDRVQDISPSLPDGYWLDPVRLEKPRSLQILRGRLCAEDRALIGEKAVPGAAMAERIYQHCSRQADFIPARLPLIEAIFRSVLASEYGGLSTEALIAALQERATAGAVPLSPALLRRLRDSARPYPLRWVDRELFGGRR